MAQWRQGSIVPAASLPTLASLAEGPTIGGISEHDWGIVLSHDCDIQSRDLKKEPWVELIVAHPVGQGGTKSTLRYGRNPRKIHFEGRVRDRPVQLEASIHDRWRVPRKELAKLLPDRQREIAPIVRRLITQWVAKRYVRSGFPDAFNDRLRGVRTELFDFLRAHDAHITAVYVDLDPPEEMPEDRIYRCAVVIVHPVEWDDPDEREAMETALREVLGKCPGIDLAGVNARSTEEFTLADMERLRRMDFDFMSYEDDDSVLPPGGIDVT